MIPSPLGSGSPSPRSLRGRRSRTDRTREQESSPPTTPQQLLPIMSSSSSAEDKNDGKMSRLRFSLDSYIAVCTDKGKWTIARVEGPVEDGEVHVKYMESEMDAYGSVSVDNIRKLRKYTVVIVKGESGERRGVIHPTYEYPKRVTKKVKQAPDTCFVSRQYQRRCACGYNSEYYKNP